jgi:hypothetical protein
LNPGGKTAADRGAVEIILRRKGHRRGAFLKVLTVALLHQFGDPPDVDLRAHADRAVLSG